MAFKTDFYYTHDKLTNQLLRKVSYKNLCQMEANAFNKLLAILTYIFKEYTGKQERYSEAIKANLDIFFIELLRHQPNRKNLSTEAKRASLAERNFQPQTSNLEPNNVNTYTQERLEEFLELLETHISSHKLVSQYADMLSLSNYQLNAITKATLGKTCSEVIDEHIILESKRHLLATSNQVTQVAYHLGYEDVSYFIRFFKKHTGYSPEAFRNNFR
jgi:AraC-like DNA-binding protein